MHRLLSEDSYGTGDDEPPSAIGAGFAFGLGIIILLNVAFSALISFKDKKALSSDASVQVEASIMSKREVMGDNNSAYFFHYEFHVPAPRTSSSLQKLSPMGGIGSFGALVTGVLTVTQQCYGAHGESLPKDCTVRYVRANPHVSEVVAIGADTIGHGFAHATIVRRHYEKKMFAILFGLFFGLIVFGVSLMMVALGWSSWNYRGEVGAFLTIAGVTVVLGFGCAVRTVTRQPIIPGAADCIPGCPKDAKITSLDAPYQKPLAAVPAAPTATAGPTTTMMAVTCPDGVAPGQTIQIAQSNGVPMQVQVPPGVAPGGVFQVAVPATLAVAPVVVIAQ
jgi:hypothetical protein